MRFAHLFLVAMAFCGISAAQEMNFSVGPGYLSLTGTTMLRSIATPSLSLDAPLPPLTDLPQSGPAVTDQEYVVNPVLEHQANLFPIYYGYPQVPVIELANTESTPELPASITGVGLTTFVDPQTLRDQGYGVSVGEASAFWEARKAPVARVYTNADIQRLPRS
jgi:hypothetical protein